MGETHDDFLGFKDFQYICGVKKAVWMALCSSARRETIRADDAISF